MTPTAELEDFIAQTAAIWDLHPDDRARGLTLPVELSDDDRARVVALAGERAARRDRAAGAVAERAAEQAPGGDADWSPEPLALDFDAEPETPDWIVSRLIERGTVVVLSGDTGAAKSIVASSLIPAALECGDWLGHRTNVERVMVVDEENPGRLVRARLRALGTSNAVRERLRYFNREGVALGDDGRSDAWVRAQLEDYRPDLLVIDTLMAACDLEDTNSNAEAVRMMKNLRGLATEFGCGILLLHHERKRSREHPSSSGQAAMGARQWIGQTDGQMTMTVESDLIEEDAETEGHRTLRRTFKWRPAEKDRDGRLNIPRRVAVTSEKDAGGRLLWMLVEDEGPIEAGNARDAHEVSILETLRDAEGDGLTTRMALAAVAGEENPKEPSGTFKRALAAAVEAGKVEKVGQRYRITAHGRDAAGLPL